ncbi:hypothetical protein ABT297_39735, partial [Dactylosporangium sp. NPDC000555]|uniref:hypothetical protein n=1 Tax=Dactylosporangium sp. NPDC000555 TaxID=3154260 RepID=UPI0033185F9A
LTAAGGLSRGMAAQLATAGGLSSGVMAQLTAAGGLSRGMAAQLATAGGLSSGVMAQLTAAGGLSRGMAAQLATAGGLSSGVMAQLTAAGGLSRGMAAQLATAAGPSIGVVAQWARLSAQFAATMPELDVDPDRRLVEISGFLSTVDAAGILKEEAEDLLQDPETWLSNTETAAESGDEQANSALLLVRYLFACFLLLARRLDPSARTVERYAPLIAISVLLVVIAGTLNANNPKLLEKVNGLLSSPIGIVSLYVALRPAASAIRSRRRKPSMPLRGASRPGRRVLRRRR